MRSKPNPLHIPLDERGLPCEKGKAADSAERGDAFQGRTNVLPFPTWARIAIVFVSLAFAGFFIARGTYGLAVVIAIGLIANEVLTRRSSQH